MSIGADGLWVFGYGSLMWRTGFPFVEARRARLDGYHRAFCITSTHHRGSPARPGLVLGLDRGGACEGMAFRVAPGQSPATLAYLRERELINGVYREAFVPVVLHPPGDGGGPGIARALAFIVERAHPSYARGLDLATEARLIRGARGVSGHGLDYLVNTVRHLQAAGIRERRLERLMAIAAAHVANAPVAADHARPGARAIRNAIWRAGGAPARRLRPDQRRRFLYRMKLGGGAFA